MLTQEQLEARRPSNLEKLRLCHGSARKEAGIPKKDSKESEEGSFLHACCHKTTFQIGENKCDLDQKEIVKRCFEYRTHLEAGATLIEREVPLTLIDPDTFEVINTGTADEIIIHGKESGMKPKITVLDYKMGYLLQPIARENIQCACYGAAAFQRYAHQYGIEVVEVHIYQPRFNYPCEPFAFTNIPAIIKNIKHVIAESEKPDAPCIPSLDACRYCRAKGPHCEKSLEVMNSIQKVESVSLPAIPDEAVAMNYEKWLQIKKVGEAVVAELKDRIAKNGSCSGYGYKPKSTGKQFIKHPFELGKDIVNHADCMALSIPSEAKYRKAWIEGKYNLMVDAGEKPTKKACEQLFYEQFGDIIKSKGATNTVVKLGGIS